MRFTVTYQIVTEESAESGDVAQSGFVSHDVRLRDAIADLFATRTSRAGGVSFIEPSDSDVQSARWFTVGNAMEFDTGAYESRDLHLPVQLTGASRVRLARLIGAAK